MLFFQSNKRKKKKTIQDYIHICVITLAIMTVVSTAFSMAKYQITRTASSTGNARAMVPHTQPFIFETDLVTGMENVNQSEICDDSVIAIANNRREFTVSNYYMAGSDFSIVNEQDITYTISLEDASGVIITDLAGNAISGAGQLSAGVDTDHQYLLTSNASMPGTYTATVAVHATAPYTKTFRQKVSITLVDATISESTDVGAIIKKIDNGAFPRTFTLSSDGHMVDVTSTGDVTYSGSGGTVTIQMEPYSSVSVKFAAAGSVSVS